MNETGDCNVEDFEENSPTRSGTTRLPRTMTV